MEPLSQEFLEQCPREKGFRMRGSEMTRIEVFVDAAFAFAVTILVISFDAIPRTFPEMVTAIKTIPAFVAAVAILIWIWHTHTLWCRRFGMDDGPTVWLSALLLVVVLIYIYPMRIMLEGGFTWITNGYLPSSFEITSHDELRLMFVFMGSAFVAVCLTLVLMYKYALWRGKLLALDHFERSDTLRVAWTWAGCLAIGIIQIALALSLPDRWVQYSGLSLALIGAWVPLVQSRQFKDQPVEHGATDD
jgi:hypothetical protein